MVISFACIDIEINRRRHARAQPGSAWITLDLYRKGPGRPVFRIERLQVTA